MPIISTEIHYRLSGGASNSDPNAALGGAKSSNQAGTNLFDDITGAQSAAGVTEYRCVYIHNANASLDLQNAVVWIQTASPGANTQINIGLGTSALNATEQTIASESTAPSGVTFSAAASKGAGVSLGTIPAGQHRAFWIRRVITAGAAALADSFTLRCEGDTAP